jgi:hypothetical protein
MQHVDEGRLHAWLDGELPAGGPDGARALERHLAGCAACRAMVEEERKIRDAASAILRDADPGPPQVIPIASARSAPHGRRTWVALGWAASVLVALGVGWIARPEAPRSVVLAPAPGPAPRAPSPAQPGAPLGVETTRTPAPDRQNRAGRPAAPTTTSAPAAPAADATAPSAPAPEADATPVTTEEAREFGSMGEVAVAPPPPPPSAPPPPPPPAEVAVPAPAAARAGRMAEAAAAPPPPAESLTVRGRVVDARGQGVPGATVSVPALAARTTTRVDGSYTLAVPASRLQGSDSIRVVASVIGMEGQARSLPAAPATVNFALRPATVALEGLVATGQGSAERRRELGSSVAGVSVAGPWRAVGRAEAERRLGSPLFIVAGLPVLGTELGIVQGSTAARVKQRLPGGEVLVLTQRRASAARAHHADSTALTVRRGRLTVEATAPIPADSLRQLLRPGG